MKESFTVPFPTISIVAEDKDSLFQVLLHIEAGQLGALVVEGHLLHGAFAPEILEVWFVDVGDLDVVLLEFLLARGLLSYG